MSDKWPAWLEKLARRLLSLPRQQRYELLLSLHGDDDADWTLLELGKIER